MNVINFELARKWHLSHYEKELCFVEAILDDIKVQRVKKDKDESILAGANVDGSSRIIVFRQANNVCTQSIQIPKQIVVHTEGVDDLMAILKKEDTPGTVRAEIFPE